MITKSPIKIPKNINSLVRIYDNSKSGDHITVVFAKPFCVDRTIPYFSYIGMSAEPFHPQGICQHRESKGEPVDRKNGLQNSAHLGNRIKFESLNHDCQQMILQDFAANEM